MARDKGGFKFASNFEVKIQGLLDPRQGVENKEDLINKETFPYDGDAIYMKEGMLVTVSSTQEVYMLISLQNILAEDYSGWKLINSTVELPELPDNLYVKPDDGIPVSDLNEYVQTSLNKAETALQEERYKGTIAAVDIDQSVDDPNISGGSYDDTEIRRMISDLSDEMKGKYGVIRMSENYDSEGYYSLELFSTKDDEILYDSNNIEYASLVTKVRIPISVSPSNFQAELSTTLKEDVNIVFAGEELDIPFIFRAIKVTLVSNENASYKGTLIVESSSDGVTWAECGRASNSLTSADIDDDTTISIVNVGKYLNVGKQYVRARAAFSFQDNIIESDNVIIGTITKTTAESSSLVLQDIYNNGITPDKIYFHNVKWNISAELMMWMADIQVSDITGTIDIEGSILFNDKNKLLARYGNVDNISSSDYQGLKLNYTKTNFDASTATIKDNFFVDDLKVYNNEYNTEEEFVFKVQPSSETQNTQTKITYSVEGSGNYTMDADGTFRVRMYELSKVEQTATVKAIVTVIKNDASVGSVVTKVIDIWLRPAQVGDLVYYDGTYSDSAKIDESKTIIGRCVYVAPRRADGSINEKFHNPNDKMTRLMVSPNNIEAGSFVDWQWGAYNNNYSSDSIFETKEDGSKAGLSIDGGTTTIYDILTITNLSANGLTKKDGTAYSYITDETMRDNTDDGLANNGFKAMNSNTACGDGFAYNEDGSLLRERTMDGAIQRLAGSGYAVGDVVNSGYAKTLRVIAHRNNILNAGLDQVGLVPGEEHFRVPEGDDELGDLVVCISAIRNWARDVMGETNYNKWSQLYYPMASACYAYEPKVRDGEVLNPRFQKHNWFLPTQGLVARMCWYTYDYSSGKAVVRANSPLNTITDTNGRTLFKIIPTPIMWSVTELNSFNSWYVGFSSGYLYNTTKYYSSVGRAVSAF